MVNVLFTTEFESWFNDLDKANAKRVAHIVKMLEQMGVALPQPYCKRLDGSKAALWELRPARGQSSIRVLYAFDPERQVVLLIGGDKAGNNKFYERIIPVAEKIWATWLAEEKES